MLDSTPSPVKLDKLKAELSSHPDREFVLYLLDGFTYGFDTGFVSLPPTSYICRNLQSGLKDPESVLSLLSKEVDKGFLLGPLDNIPFQDYRINPIGLAEHKYSKKKRLIVDMSAPHNNLEHPSLNSLIDKEAHSLQYVTIDDAIRLINRDGSRKFQWGGV